MGLFLIVHELERARKPASNLSQPPPFLIIHGGASPVLGPHSENERSFRRSIAGPGGTSAQHSPPKFPLDQRAFEEEENSTERCSQVLIEGTDWVAGCRPCCLSKQARDRVQPGASEDTTQTPAAPPQGAREEQIDPGQKGRRSGSQSKLSQGPAGGRA